MEPEHVALGYCCLIYSETNLSFGTFSDTTLTEAVLGSFLRAFSHKISVLALPKLRLDQP